MQLFYPQRDGEEEPVDVEGEYEEYEWAGQTRVRATSMLEGGFSGKWAGSDRLRTPSYGFDYKW